jgi:6-phosphogluconolactonase (cycloisomerase 2 family)
MKVAKWLLLLAAMVPVLTGCASFWDNSTSSTSTTTSTTTLSSGIFYVLNVETEQIVAYYVSAGTLTKIASYTTPDVPVTLAVAPNNDHLYLSTASGIYVYTIGSTGALTIANSGSVISSDEAYTMQVDTTSGWLIEAVSGDAQVNALALNSSTGLLSSTTERSITLYSSTIQQLAISPNNDYVFVAMGTGGTQIIPFTSTNSNPFGSTSRLAVYGSGGAALSVAVDPSERLLYIGETAVSSSTNSGGLRAFKISSGSFSELSASPFASQGLAPYSILPEAGGSYVYVANRQTSSGSTGVIAGFTVASSSSTYTLTALSSTYTAGTHTVALAEDSTDQFLFAVNYGGSYDLTGYTFDSAGALTTVVQSTTGTDPVEASAIAAQH